MRSDRKKFKVISKGQIREWVSDVLMLRSAFPFKAQEEELLRTGAVRNIQIRGGDVKGRVAELRALAPGPLLVAADMETGSSSASDGTALPPQMALGAANSEELAFAWGRAVGWEARRLGIDVAFGPVLDLCLNTDNPIINVRSLGDNPGTVGRLGSAVVRGFAAAGLHGSGKHWPSPSDLAVDTHIALGRSAADARCLRAVEWQPYRAAIAAGLDGIMSSHVLVPAIDPERCATVSPALIAPLRSEYGFRGLIYTDSLGMEGLRRTVDSAEAAWQAIAAGHDVVLIDYKRAPAESVEAVVAAAADGRLPLARLQEAAETVRQFRAGFSSRPSLPPESEIRLEMERVGRQVARASITARQPDMRRVALGARPLAIVCDDLQQIGRDVADELGKGRTASHPVTGAVLGRLPADVLVLNEETSRAEAADALERASKASAVLGIPIARIAAYKGSGSRLPESQQGLWSELAQRGKLSAMILLGSPSALADMPGKIPTVVGYGAESFSVEAALDAVLEGMPCKGRFPVKL